jgi:hypothetical protein
VTVSSVGATVDEVGGNKIDPSKLKINPNPNTNQTHLNLNLATVDYLERVTGDRKRRDQERREIWQRNNKILKYC